MPNKTNKKMLTMHPSGKQGVNIDADKYEQVKQAILKTLEENSELTFKELSEKASQKLGSFDGSPQWYITTIKLDLEARGEISVTRSSPQLISKA